MPAFSGVSFLALVEVDLLDAIADAVVELWVMLQLTTQGLENLRVWLRFFCSYAFH